MLLIARYGLVHAQALVLLHQTSSQVGDAGSGPDMHAVGPTGDSTDFK